MSEQDAPRQVDRLDRRVERPEARHRLARRHAERLAPGVEARLEARGRVLDDEDVGRREGERGATELAELCGRASEGEDEKKVSGEGENEET